MCPQILSDLCPRTIARPQKNGFRFEKQLKGSAACIHYTARHAIGLIWKTIVAAIVISRNENFFNAN